MDDWPPTEPGHSNRIVEILLFPFRAVFVVVVWIVGVWLWLLSLAIFIGIPIVIGLFIFNLVADGDSDTAPELREYVSEVIRLNADWTDESEKIESSTNFDATTEEQYWIEVETFGRDYRRITSEYTGALARLQPPPEAEELHMDLLIMLRELDDQLGDFQSAAVRRSFTDLDRVAADFLLMLNEVDALDARWDTLLEESFE